MNHTNEAAVKISDALKLTLNIQAVRFIEDPSEVPESAVNAHDRFGHLSLCQAFALVKRDGLTLYTDKSSEWCWAPVVALGYADCSPGSETFEIIKPLMGVRDLEKADKFFREYPRLPLGKYKGLLLAPADKAEFEADVLLINCDDNFQMRSLLSAVKVRNEKKLEVSLDPIDSCIYTLVTSFITKDYSVALPDPGEQERALSGKNEIIMSVPAEKLDDLMAGFESRGFRHVQDPELPQEMEFDFPRPPFYNEVFRLWGMEQGKDWSLR
ncbi:MAG: DUF169 domain-containing protein [Oscillospiraceae bacterium]|nr:DUF169 domain-containing protein [Oscillospiraceae bacterium]